MLSAALTTLGHTFSAALVATAAAVPVALLAWRRDGRFARGAERAAFLTRALPGIAVALSVVHFAIQYAQPPHQQPPMLVTGYVILYVPLALTAVRAALAQVPPGVEEVARPPS
ncbi:hypothetical protein GCM10025734_14820 [Kitasatospora paranensis]